MSTSNQLPSAGSHKVPLHYAIQLTSRFRNNRELVLANAYKGQDILPFSETFNKDDIESLLEQNGAAGMRIYYGMDENLSVHAVLVATNPSNEDILPSESAETDAVIIQEGQRCPVICPPSSPLND